jgi:hypothetical protein
VFESLTINANDDYRAFWNGSRKRCGVCAAATIVENRKDEDTSRDLTSVLICVPQIKKALENLVWPI